jgi:hypothetical protein
MYFLFSANRKHDASPLLKFVFHSTIKCSRHCIYWIDYMNPLGATQDVEIDIKISMFEGGVCGLSIWKKVRNIFKFPDRARRPGARRGTLTVAHCRRSVRHTDSDTGQARRPDAGGCTDTTDEDCNLELGNLENERSFGLRVWELCSPLIFRFSPTQGVILQLPPPPSRPLLPPTY